MRRSLPFVETAAVSLALAGTALAGGAVKGVVKYQGIPPERAELKIDKDTETCAHDKIFDEKLIVGKDGGIQNAVLTIEKVEGGKKLEVPAAPVAYDQKGCRFSSHVVVVPVGAKVDFLNSDPVAHNIHTYARKNTAFNTDVPGGGKYTMEAKFPEKVKVTCDRHKWMEGYIVVVDTPYAALSGADGSFAIPDLPPGKYSIKVWHESLGAGPATDVEVPASDDAAPATITLAPKEKKAEKTEEKKGS